MKMDAGARRTREVIFGFLPIQCQSGSPHPGNVSFEPFDPDFAELLPTRLESF